MCNTSKWTWTSRDALGRVFITQFTCTVHFTKSEKKHCVYTISIYIYIYNMFLFFLWVYINVIEEIGYNLAVPVEQGRAGTHRVPCKLLS